MGQMTAIIRTPDTALDPQSAHTVPFLESVVFRKRSLTGMAHNVTKKSSDAISLPMQILSFLPDNLRTVPSFPSLYQTSSFSSSNQYAVLQLRQVNFFFFLFLPSQFGIAFVYSQNGCASRRNSYV
jgi:hypothetical protein